MIEILSYPQMRSATGCAESEATVQHEAPNDGRSHIKLLTSPAGVGADVRSDTKGFTPACGLPALGR